MYKYFICIGLFLLTLLVGTAPSCEAIHHMENVNGVLYYNGDSNLPIYSAGSGGFCVAERNSAVLVSESEKTAVVDFYGFNVTYQYGVNHPVEPPEESGFRTRRFVYHKDKNEVALIEGAYQCKLPPYALDALKLVYESAKNCQTPTGTSGSGNAAQVDRDTSLGKFVDLYKKYSDASDKIYNELDAALADTSTGVTKEKLSKEKDAIKQLKKLNEKMAKEDPLKGFKGYSVGEREKFTDLFDGLTEYNDAMIALLEYVVAHPTDGDHDQLVNLTAQVIKVQGDQKDRAAAVQEILQKK